MKLEKRLELIKRNTEEVTTEEELEELLKEKDKFNFYLGVAPTGPFHLGHIVPFTKCIEIARAGGQFTFLVADFHAYLDDQKTGWEEMKARADYLEICARALWPSDLPINIARGSSYQRKPEFMEKLIKATALVTVSRAERAAREITRMETPKVSELVYPIMQDLDVMALDADLEVGAIDQRGAFMLGREILPKMGKKPEVDVMPPLIPSLQGPGVKMSSSKPKTCIAVHDSPRAIREKIEDAYCPAGKIEDNPILEICKRVLFPRFEKLKIERPEKYGGNLTFDEYEELEEKFTSGDLHPADLKKAVAEKLIEMLEPVRKALDKNPKIFKEFKKTVG